MRCWQQVVLNQFKQVRRNMEKSLKSLKIEAIIPGSAFTSVLKMLMLGVGYRRGCSMYREPTTKIDARLCCFRIERWCTCLDLLIAMYTMGRMAAASTISIVWRVQAITFITQVSHRVPDVTFYQWPVQWRSCGKSVNLRPLPSHVASWW